MNVIMCFFFFSCLIIQTWGWGAGPGPGLTQGYHLFFVFKRTILIWKKRERKKESCLLLSAPSVKEHLTPLAYRNSFTGHSRPSSLCIVLVVCQVFFWAENNPFHPHTCVVCTHFYKRRNWGKDRLSNLGTSTQLVTVRACVGSRQSECRVRFTVPDPARISGSQPACPLDPSGERAKRAKG